MSLCEGGRGGGSLVEFREEFIDGGSELLLYDGGHLLEGEGPCLVLELCQFGGELLPDEVRPGGEHLPDLDIDRTQLLQHLPHSFLDGEFRGGAVVSLPAPDEVPQFSEEDAQPVAEDHAENFPYARHVRIRAVCG